MVSAVALSGLLGKANCQHRHRHDWGVGIKARRCLIHLERLRGLRWQRSPCLQWTHPRELRCVARLLRPFEAVNALQENHAGCPGLPEMRRFITAWLAVAIWQSMQEPAKTSLQNKHPWTFELIQIGLQPLLGLCSLEWLNLVFSCSGERQGHLRVCVSAKGFHARKKWLQGLDVSVHWLYNLLMCIYIYIYVVIYTYNYFFGFGEIPNHGSQGWFHKSPSCGCQCLKFARSTMVRASHLTLPQWFRIWPYPHFGVGSNVRK